MSRSHQKKETSSGDIVLLETFGDELTIVNSARVSFGVEKSELDEKDAKLIRYLVRHQHFSPFRHVFLRFKIRAPEFVMRQWYKHVVGAEWTSTHASQLHGWNEISGRYVVQDDMYCPLAWRKQSESNKQGSAGLVDDMSQNECHQVYKDCVNTIQTSYRRLLELGVAKEQARCLLPLSSMTQVIWTCSLQTAIHFVDLRNDEHTQQETREFAEHIDAWLRELYPHSYRAFRENRNK